MYNKKDLSEAIKGGTAIMDERTNRGQESAQEEQKRERLRENKTEEEFATTYFPRRDRSHTMYYGKSNARRQRERQETPPSGEIQQNITENAEHREDRVTEVPMEQPRTRSYHVHAAQKQREEMPDHTVRYVDRKASERERLSERVAYGHHETQERKTKRKRKRHMTKGFKFVLILVFALLIGFGSFQFMKGIMITEGSTDNLTGETVSITIPAGSGTADIAQILKENGLISSTLTFRLSSKINGYDGTYQQGTYDVDVGMTPTQIMALLQTGSVQNENRITIPEGYTVQQIAQRAEETGICTAEEFINEVNTGTFPHTFIQDLPEREYQLEGYLFPDTYFLSDEMTAHDLIVMMLDRFEQMYTEEYQTAVANSGYTLDEIVTIASMVEKEITLDEERARAAGVIYNRLEENMTLGIDATVLYAVGKNGGELTAEDLQTDSPYNTRLNPGLPYGPIANPGEASFRAALYPEEHNYLYYVVEAAGMDNHVFCETYDEFLTARANYQASLSE